MARPSNFTIEIADYLCEQVALGYNLNQLTQREDMPCQTAVYKWLKDFPQFAKNYARARELRADTRFDKVDAIIEEMRAGELDPNAARVALDAIKWQAGKENPKIYGDRTTLELDASENLAAVLLERRRALESRQAIDVTPEE